MRRDKGRSRNRASAADGGATASGRGEPRGRAAPSEAPALARRPPGKSGAGEADGGRPGGGKPRAGKRGTRKIGERKFGERKLEGRTPATGKPGTGQASAGMPGPERPAAGKPGGRHRRRHGRQRIDRAPVPSGRPTTEMRIAKALARAGLCSRREAERWIGEGRVKVNGEVIASPARDVGPRDRIEIDGEPLPDAAPPRLWRYHKPRGLVTSHRDPEGRQTVFEVLPKEMGRVVSVGRLDFNTEGLLLLTNDGALARHMELPATGWLRRYRVRAHGRVTQADLDRLKEGVEIDGVRYGPVEAALDQEQGSNVWLTIGLREGKNREVRRILATLGLDVNRLIRVSFGPFQLLDLPPGQVEPVKRRILADQLGPRLAQELGLDGDEEAKKPAGGSGGPERRPGPRRRGGERAAGKPRAAPGEDAT